MEAKECPKCGYWLHTPEHDDVCEWLLWFRSMSPEDQKAEMDMIAAYDLEPEDTYA